MIRQVAFFIFFVFGTSAFAQETIQNQVDSNTTRLELETLKLQAEKTASQVEDLSKKIDNSVRLFSGQVDYVIKILTAIGSLIGLFILLEFFASWNRHRAEKQVAEIQADSITKTSTLIGSINDILKTVAAHDERVSSILDRSERTADETEKQLTRLREIEKRKFDDALKEANSFLSFSRMEFAALSSQAVGHSERLKQLVEELRGDAMTAYGDEIDRGYIYYICGVLYYYDEKPSLALEYLNLSASEKPQGDPINPEVALKDKYRQSFTHYFKSIIMKNWGTLDEAIQQIDLCESLFPPQEYESELLNPTTKAEILSYFSGKEPECLDLIAQCKNKVKTTSDRVLNARQTALYDRLILIEGNVYNKLDQLKEAEENYLQLFKERPRNYYAATSLALLEHQKKNKERRSEYFKAALDRFRASAVLDRKFELTTRATLLGLSTLAQCGVGNEERAIRFFSELTDLVARRQVGESMVPRFFSPTQKTLVGADHLVDEIEGLGSTMGVKLR